MTHRPAWRWRASLSCLLGVAVIVVCLVPPLGRDAHVYLWVRALQFLLLGLAGPGLIVASGSGSGPATRVSTAGTRPRRLPAAGPVTAVIVSNVAWLGWQLPALVDLERTNTPVALAGYACWIGAGLLFWRPLIPSAGHGPASPLRGIALLVRTVADFTVLGMVLAFGSGVLYPAYSGAAHQVMTVLDDQQLSGAVLWMGSLPAFIVAGFALMLQWLGNEESAAEAAGTGLLRASRKTGWPARPVAR